MIYFDNSATSRFKPDCVIDSMNNCIKNSSNPGRSAHSDSLSISEEIFSARELIKSTFDANSTSEVIFTKNASEALNIAILGYLRTFNHKVHVITSMMEHNSVLRPLRYLARIGLIEVTILPIINGEISLSSIELYIKNNTKLIIMNGMSNVVGTTADIELLSDISREYCIPLLLDGAQLLGHCRLSLENTPIAMLAGAGHKGLHGPQGSGFLLVDTAKVQLLPLTYGGTGTNSNLLDMPIEYPESYEIGTLPSPAIVGLANGIRWTYDNFDAVNNTILKYSRLIYTYLKNKSNIELYTPYPTSVLSFNVDGYTSSEIGDYLNEQNIAVRSGLHCAPLVHTHYGTLERGMVRVSVGYNNTIADIDALTRALDNIPII